MPPSTDTDARNHAIWTGEKTYQGQVCKQGHNGLRYVANRACVICVKERERLTYDRHVAAARKRTYRAKVKGTPSPIVDLGIELLESL